MDAEELVIAIEMSFLQANGQPPLQWTRLLTGRPDRITFDPLTGLIVIDGRDNAAKLLDQPLLDSYLNKTASEIARNLGASCGLSVVADDTTGLIGQYYQIQHSKTVFGAHSKHSNGWDLLCELAQIQNFELWVDADTLYFQKLRPDFTPFQTRITSSASGQGYIEAPPFMDIQLERSLGLSGPIRIIVSSWNSKQKQIVVQSYPDQSTSGEKVFTIVKPNLLPDEAMELARSTYLQIRARHRIFTGWMPGELTLSPRKSLRLAGSETDWDATYVIDEISRHYSSDRGFTQSIIAITVPEESTA